MAFVNEKVRSTNSEVARYAATLATGLGFIESWTIDRERNLVLIEKWTARQDMYDGDFSITGWLFYWKGEWISFTKQTDLGGKISDKYWESRTKIKDLIVPTQYLDNRSDILNDLIDALQVYKVAGAFSEKDYEFNLILDLSEVL
ncbi:MAG: hypothetical protein WA154_04880 [Moraxellaceae bacterium]